MPTEINHSANPTTPANKSVRLGPWIARYSLALVFVWFAGLKFTSYEANGIALLTQHSPFLSWIYHFVSVTTFSDLLGVAELMTALLLAVGPLSPRTAVLGASLASLFFIGTLSFMLTTPGIGEQSAGGFLLLSAAGEFLLKDVGLLGLSLWLFIDAVAGLRHHATGTNPAL
jgi:uncharacterized membrane protein YkgB